MRIGIILGAVLFLLSLVPFSLQEPSQDTALATDQTWQEDYQPEAYRGEKEEETPEEETTRRPRGKRRRRMRKRQRVQPAEEDVDRASNVGQNQEAPPADENTTPAEVPRRRPGKRRRRPYRRHQEEDGAPIKRRRRKGGRKKIKQENQEVPQTDSPMEEIKNENEQETTIPPMQTTISTIINSVLDDEKPTDIPKETTTIKKDEVNNDVKAENEENTKTAGYGSKIFDRKKLFSNPRRTLPVTSAVIRKFGPYRSNNPETTTQPEIKDAYETKLLDKALIKSNSVPESQPEVIKPEKLVHAETKVQSVQDDKEEDEEPNYPKILPKPIYRNKIRNYETTTILYTTTEKVETTKIPERETEVPPQNDPVNDMTVTEFEKMLENLDVDSFNATVGDYVLDLLKTKTGKEDLSKILGSRNMTIAQLLEHRERGSSKFHLFEMFPQKKKQNKSTQTTTTTPTMTTIEDKQIQFPSEDVLGSFPKFVSDEIEKHEQKNDNKIADNETESTINQENREPRLFDSMPEFTTLSVSSTTKNDKHPTWRVIPNPKLRPVSVRGNYEEIPISNVLNRPVENNINDIYIVDERESIVHHKKYGLSSDRMKSRDSFGNFKKIPVGVKSAMIISGIILAIATFGFLSLLISCRVRQKRTLMRAKQDMMCEHLQNDDFMTSQQSLSPVLTKHQQVYNPHQEHHAHPHNRHYYLWRTIRRTFRYE